MSLVGHEKVESQLMSHDEKHFQQEEMDSSSGHHRMSNSQRENRIMSRMNQNGAQ